MSESIYVHLTTSSVLARSRRASALARSCALPAAAATCRGNDISVGAFWTSLAWP